MNKKQDFTLYQRIRIFLYRYNTFWLELIPVVLAFVIYLLSTTLFRFVPPMLSLLGFFPSRGRVEGFFLLSALVLPLFIVGFTGWVRIIKGERSTKHEIVRSKVSVFSGIVWVLFTWGFACFILFTVFQLIFDF